MSEDRPRISFDVLLRGDSTDVAHVAVDVHKLRPKLGVIEFCLRSFSELGVTCHRLDFGLACEAPPELFESLFGVTVTGRTDDSGHTVYEVSGEPRPPKEIAQHVDQITIARPPTLFA